MLGGKSASGMPLGTPQPGVLAIRVWKAPTILFAPPEEGGLIAVPQVGSAEAVAAVAEGAWYHWLRDNQFTLAVALLSSVVSLICLLLGLRNRRNLRVSERGSGNYGLLFWLAVVLAYPLELFLLGASGIVLGISFRWGYGLIGIVIGIYEAALWFVLIHLLGLAGNRRLVQWTKVMVGLLWALDALDGGLQLFDWTQSPHLFLTFDAAFTIVPVLVEFWGVVLVLFAFQRRLDAARWVLVICALLANLVQALGDLGGMGSRWTHWTLESYIDAPLCTLAGSPLNIRTISSTLLLIAILYVAWRYSIEQNERQTAIEQEYRSAQELQKILIPESLPTLPSYDIISAYRPAQQVGGDFFQLIPLADNSSGGSALLVIGDVSGKGLHAAMTVALIVGALRSTIEITSDPAAILAALNRRVYGRLRDGFVTCLVLRLDSDGNCQLANAGHLPPFLNGSEIALPPALPLGIIPSSEYESTNLRINAGDHLTLYTDGLPEARNAHGELFGFTRIAELLLSAPDGHELAAAAQQFGQEDDITVLTLCFAPAGAVHA